MTTLGFRVVEEQVTKRRVGLSQTRRTMHLALLGKTGTGKSSLLKYLCLEDIEADSCTSICTAMRRRFSCGRLLARSGSGRRI
jgi:guanylate kinase